MIARSRHGRKTAFTEWSSSRKEPVRIAPAPAQCCSLERGSACTDAPGGWGADDIRNALEIGPFEATLDRIEAEFGHATAQTGQICGILAIRKDVISQADTPPR
jgi:hypothetical protein